MERLYADNRVPHAKHRRNPWVLTAVVVCARGLDGESVGQSLPPDTAAAGSG